MSGYGQTQTHSPFKAESDSLVSASVEFPAEECRSPVLRTRSGQDCQQQGCSPSHRNPFTRDTIFSIMFLSLQPSTPGWLLPHHSNNSSAEIQAPEEKQFVGSWPQILQWQWSSWTVSSRSQISILLFPWQKWCLPLGMDMDCSKWHNQ